VRRRGEAIRCVRREGKGKVEARVAHCCSPRGVRSGSGREWFAVLRLW
jgi:hypothetical protein